MRVLFTPHLERSYAKLSFRIQRAFDKQLALLLRDLRHPSLRAKKYDEGQDIWQARITGGYRFYFRIEGDTYKIISITSHTK